MTKLIIALDDKHPNDTMSHLFSDLTDWFAIGPQSLLYFDWKYSVIYPNIKMFLNLKLCDTDYTVSESVKRYADIGYIAAVSTFTRRATEAAIRAAEGSPLKIWQTVFLTDSVAVSSSCLGVHGVICPGHLATMYKGLGIDIVCPGVRLESDITGSNSIYNHVDTFPAERANSVGITHAIVGRPLKKFPRAAAHQYIYALSQR